MDRSETIGRPIYELGNGQWNNPQLRLLLEEVIPHSSAVIDFEVEHDFPEIGKRTMLFTVRTRVDRNRPSRSILVSISDATERRQKEAAQLHGPPVAKFCNSAPIDQVTPPTGERTVQ